jgi:hypothetical protein
LVNVGELRLEPRGLRSSSPRKSQYQFFQVAPHPVNAGGIAMTQATKAKLDAVLDAMAEHDRALIAANDDPRAQRRITNDFWERQYARQHELAKQFGKINKWKLTTTQFGLDEFGRRQPRPQRTDGGFDHALYYRDCYGRFAAIVNQPYDRPDYCRGTGRASSYDLTWQTPPEPYASIWYPGFTRFIVITRPGQDICWLPEQVAPGPVLAKVLERKNKKTRPSPLVTRSLEGSYH